MQKSKVMEIVIGFLAIVSIALIVVEALESLDGTALLILYIVDLLICIVFFLDFIVRLKASEKRSAFLKSNSYELLAMIPAVAFNAAGTIPLIDTLFRSLRLVRVVRIIFLAARIRRVMSTSGRFLKRSHLVTMAVVTASVIFIGAFSVSLLENGLAGAQINGFSDALWWSISTVTTVGYGDIVPHTVAGRLIGMVLMVIGIGVMAALISEVSATLVESRIKVSRDKPNFKARVINDIKNQIDNIDTMTDEDIHTMFQLITSLRKGDVKNIQTP